ncbi:hypothetical protein JCM10449v2_003250 [Rhodotorula kratochvilovae]
MDASNTGHNAHTPARLPNELILHVLEQVDRPIVSLTDNERDERRRTLYAACLVSRNFFKAAQPILWRRLRLQVRRWGNGDNALEVAVQTMRKASVTAKATLALEIGDYIHWRPLKLGHLAAFWPNVEELVVHDVTHVDFSEIARFSNLRDLRASRFTPFLSEEDTCFARLETLVCDNFGLNWGGSGRDIFTSDTLPALRHLFLRAYAYRGRDTPILPSSFVAQLDDLQLEVNGAIKLESGGWPFVHSSLPPGPVLFHTTFDLNQLLQLTVWLPVHHLQVTTPTHSLPLHQLRVEECLTSLNRLLGDRSPPPLRLLLLPSSCWPPNATLDPRMAASSDVLAANLASYGVEIRAYDASRPLDGLVVPEFREFLREQAAWAGA